MSKLIDC